MSRTTPFESQALDFNPFEADRDSRARVLRDEIVTSRVSEPCEMCLCPLVPFTRTRARTEFYAGKVMTFRFCAECVRAMALCNSDNGEAVQRRTELGVRASRSGRGR
jgi:hypothetical protein